MLLYIVIVLLCYIMAVSKNREIGFVIFIIVALFLCCGYMTGSDWRNYETMYYSSKFGEFNNDKIEVGYSIFTTFFNYIGVNFWIFWCLLKIVLFGVVVKTVRSIGVSLWLFLAIFLPEIGYHWFINNPMRNLIACVIFMSSFSYLIERRIVPYMLLAILAALFHFSALIMIPIYFLSKVKISNKVYVVIFIAAFLLSLKLDFLIELILKLVTKNQFIASRTTGYFLNSGYLLTSLNIGLLYRVFLFSLLLIQRRKIEEKYTFGKVIISLSMLYFILYPIAIPIQMSQRFLYYVLPFMIISMIYVINTLSKVLYQQVFTTIIVIFSLLNTYKLVTANCFYIPYTNCVLNSLKGDVPSYEFRSNYNIRYSPYKQVEKKSVDMK